MFRRLETRDYKPDETRPSCDPLTTQTNTPTSSSCGGTAPDGSINGLSYQSFANAQASASITFLSDGFTVRASVQAESGSPNPELQTGADARATVTLTDTIGTAGPVRAGFVELSCFFSCYSGNDGGAGGGSASMTLGSLGCGGFGGQQADCPTGVERPVELGEGVQLSVTAIADGPGCALCDVGEGSASFGVMATFYEANGTTPVSVYDADNPLVVETPEPGTSFLIAIGLLALFTRRIFCIPIR